MEEKEIGLYIHMPFCKQKCYYCDFVSYPNRYEMVERYIKCLKSEIVQYANENRIMHEHGLEPKFIIKTIYIGGGTPSSIDELMRALGIAMASSVLWNVDYFKESNQ